MNGESFDLFRIASAKKAVDICPNTLREYFKGGLQSYKRGKAVFVSKTELIQFIKSSSKQKSK